MARVQRKAQNPLAETTLSDPSPCSPIGTVGWRPQAAGARADGPKELFELVDAAHESFSLDAKGRVLTGGRAIAELTRGASLTLPEVRLLDQSAIGAGLRLRLQRRLLAFARDAVTRLLEPLRALGRSPRGAVRAVAYQLEQGLGTALSLRTRTIPGRALGRCGARAAQGRGRDWTAQRVASGAAHRGDLEQRAGGTLRPRSRFGGT